MPKYDIVALICGLILAILAAWISYKLLKLSLRALLDRVVELPEVTNFYLRAFAAIVFLVALEGTAGGVHPQAGAHALEYVWSVAGELSSVFEGLVIAFLLFAAFVTVLIAVLRPRNAK